MIAKKWRERLTYVAMSALLAWHTLAMVIAPAPDNDLTESLQVVLQPYLTFLRLDGQWQFFAPTLGEGSRLRYVIQDRTGKNHTFMPAEELSWFHPNFIWFRSWYYRIMDDPDNYGDYAAAQFCRKHASLQPLAITFYEIQEEKFTREDYLSGKSRMAPEFFTIKMLRGIRCPEE